MRTVLCSQVALDTAARGFEAVYRRCHPAEPECFTISASLHGEAGRACGEAYEAIGDTPPSLHRGPRGYNSQIADQPAPQTTLRVDGTPAAGRCQEHSVAKMNADAQKEQILNAAAKLFIEKGFGGASMQEIAEALGVTRTAVYYYFKNKDEILTALVEEVTLRAKRLSSRVSAETSDDPKEGLRALVRQHTMLILSHHNEFRVIDRTEQQLPERAYRANEDAKRAVLNNFTHAIEAGVSAGVFRVVDAKITAFTLIGMCSWPAFWYKPEGTKSADEIAGTIAELAVQSVIRPAKRQLKGASGVSEAIALLREDLDHLSLMVEKTPKSS
jgi:AcrR family transcriptional regulator